LSQEAVQNIEGTLPATWARNFQFVVFGSPTSVFDVNAELLHHAFFIRLIFKKDFLIISPINGKLLHGFFITMTIQK